MVSIEHDLVPSASRRELLRLVGEIRVVLGIVSAIPPRPARTQGLEPLSDDTSYQPTDFFELVQRYHQILSQALIFILRTTLERPEIQSSVVTLGKQISILSLVEDVSQSIQNLDKRMTELEQSLATFYAPAEFPPMREWPVHVPNISPRELRLWCQMNTTQFHQQVDKTRGAPALLGPILGKCLALSYYFSLHPLT